MDDPPKRVVRFEGVFGAIDCHLSSWDLDVTLETLIRPHEARVDINSQLCIWDDAKRFLLWPTKMNSLKLPNDVTQITLLVTMRNTYLFLTLSIFLDAVADLYISSRDEPVEIMFSRGQVNAEITFLTLLQHYKNKLNGLIDLNYSIIEIEGEFLSLTKPLSTVKTMSLKWTLVKRKHSIYHFNSLFVFNR